MTQFRIRRGFAETAHGQIHYREAGSGQPVVLLHLNSGTSVMFQPSMPYFAEKYRPIAIDYPGYGDSETPPELYTEMGQWADAIVRFLDAMGIEKAHLVGHQTGSQVAAETAAKYPGRVEKVVLSDVFSWNRPHRRAAHEALHKAFPPSEDFPELPAMWNAAAQLTQLPGRPVNWQAWSNQFISNLRLKVRYFGEPDPPGTVYGEMGWDGAVPYSMCRHDVLEALAKVTAPTLILHTGDGRFVKSHDSMLAAARNATGYIIPGGIASTPIADPETWTKPILEFLDG